MGKETNLFPDKSNSSRLVKLLKDFGREVNLFPRMFLYIYLKKIIFIYKYNSAKKLKLPISGNSFK